MSLDKMYPEGYNKGMEARPRTLFKYTTPTGEIPFSVWFSALRDGDAKTAIAKRLRRAEAGTLGHCDNVGEGVWGFKIDVGPGYRVYFGQDGPVLVILLCGGEKHGQQRDVNLALKFWSDYKKRKRKELNQ